MPRTFISMIPLHTMFSGRAGMPSPRALEQPQALHSCVMRLFGQIEGKRAEAGILFRIEPASDSRPGALLIRSNIAPEITLEGMAVKHEPSAPAAGTPLAFRLSANAVRRQKNGGVQPVPRDDDTVPGFDGMTEWVASKLAGAISSVELLHHDRMVSGMKSERTVQIDMVDGFGVVEDPEKLAALLAGGVGRAKNYGCGLLTVKPIG